MNLNPDAEVFVPSGSPADNVLAATTHLGIGAHQDDIEILALHGILQCLHDHHSSFSGITCTDGAGSARTGKFADVTDDQMKEIRWEEQRKAASMGDYNAVIQLKHPSSVIKNPADSTLVDELESLLLATSPSVVYTHNLADKHDTHIAVAAATVKALRRMPEGKIPEKVYGVEIWRSLDWLADDRKVLLDVSRGADLAPKLLGLFESQIAGGKRYDQATIGRWHANATFLQSHSTDTATLMAYAMDLTPLVTDRGLDPSSLPLQEIDNFKNDVSERLARSFNN